MPVRRSPVPGLPNPTTNPNTAGPPRITPRNSDADEAIAAAATKETPYGTLRQLANLPKPTTPLRRASSVGPPSHKALRRTPAGQARTPGAAQKLGGSARRANVLTPHGRAAVREVEARRAGFTPAKNRRQSGRQQRETPRDALRALSRVLAPKTLPVVPTPQDAAPTGRFTLPGNDDLDDDAALERPRLSLALGDEDEDDSLLLPPQSAGLEDENYTVQSVEFPRRAVSEQPGRLSRGSFGSIRMSDQFADLNNVGGVFESSFAMGGAFDDDAPDMDDGPREETATLRNLDLERGRSSDIRPTTFTGDDTENTFVFTVPQREVQEQQGEPLPDLQDSPMREDSENYDLDEVDGIDAEEPEEDEKLDSISSSPGRADVEMTSHDTTLQSIDHSVLEIQQNAVKKKKKVKVSRHGIQYPSLPVGVVKKLATTYARTSGNSKAKINKETLDAIVQASDWFFEQVSDDLGAYAKHAGRKTIDENDVVTLMKRQRQTNANTTPFSLAQRYLPRELLQELRMVPPSKLRKGKQLDRVEEAEED